MVHRAMWSGSFCSMNSSSVGGSSGFFLPRYPCRKRGRSLCQSSSNIPASASTSSGIRVISEIRNCVVPLRADMGMRRPCACRMC